MLNLFAGACVGAVFGFLLCAWISANKGSDCINCSGLIQREQDLMAVTKSRDILRNRCDQLELMVHSLRTKMGLKNSEIQRTVFLAQKEA